MQLQVTRDRVVVLGVIALSMAGCRTTGEKHAEPNSHLASIEIAELPTGGYTSYQIGLTPLDPNGQAIAAMKFPKGTGKYNVTVTTGHYKVLLDYYDSNNQKVYSADYCTPLVANNSVNLVAGANPLSIKVCTVNATVLDATVTIQPVLYTGGGQTQNPAGPTPLINPTTPTTPTTPTGEVGVIQQNVRQAMATHFDGLGTPYGGCGVPESVAETSNFVALNVQSTPNDYGSFLARPITQAGSIGEFNNGLNCGRWVQVTMGNFCQGGASSGQPNTDFCAGGQWVSNQYTGSKLNMVVVDSCQDNNRWCRDDKYHLDISTSSLTQFGGGIDANAWGNPQISWTYIDAPNYSGDIQIGFAQKAQAYWAPVIINHLQRGIHKVEQNIGGSWVQQKMNSDMGQSYILTGDGSGTFKIRVYDANDQLISNGRVYVFSFPASCGSACAEAYTQVGYTTE